MKQLITQERIDEAVKELFCGTANHEEKDGFKNGVQFALNEIEPFICALSEWAYKNYDYIERISNKNEWVWKKNNDVFTTKQLLEEFINEKANKDE